MSEPVESADEEILWEIGPLPRDQKEALEWLLALVAAADKGRLPEVPLDAFQKGWFALAFLYPGLHPDAVLENGAEIAEAVLENGEIWATEPRLVSPWFLASGWPVVLLPVAAEARRRYEAGELKEQEFYCSEATLAGMCFRDPGFAREIRKARAPK